jgi:hypothetical protein
MHPDIGASRGALDQNRRRGQCGDVDSGHQEGRPGRGGGDERERYGVSSRLAGYEMGRAVVHSGWRLGVCVCRWPVVVLGMIVPVIPVNVEWGHPTQRRHQRGDQHARESAGHSGESTG